MVKAAPLLTLSFVLGAMSALGVLGGCSQAATTADTAAPSSATGVVIAQIVTHDSKVAILGGVSGRDLRVVVRKMDGTMVADGVSLEELRTRAPDLYMVVTSAFASSALPSAGTGTSYVDATLDLGHLN
jgi:hypothetical protein